MQVEKKIAEEFMPIYSPALKQLSVGVLGSDHLHDIGDCPYYVEIFYNSSFQTFNRIVVPSYYHF